MKDQALWQRLAPFPLDDPRASLPFSKRLARENDWSHTFALRAIEEYKRFVYLAAVADHPVTPSESVDAVWHLHLCYSRSYWEALCRDVLKRPLHHCPTQGGTEQRELFRSQYRQTLASYEREFGRLPPDAIWPAVEVQFAPARHPPAIATTDYFVVSKRALYRALLGGACVSAGVFAIGCNKEELIETVSARPAAVALVLGIATFVICLAIGLRRVRRSEKRRGRGNGSGCSGGYECGNDGDGCGGGCGGD